VGNWKTALFGFIAIMVFIILFAIISPRAKSHNLPCFHLEQFLSQYNENTKSKVFFKSATSDGGFIRIVLNQKGEWLLIVTPADQLKFACPLSNGTLKKPDTKKVPSSDT
jgi:hypothetical protein